jgi:hypothetical protein
MFMEQKRGSNRVALRIRSKKGYFFKKVSERVKS